MKHIFSWKKFNEEFYIPMGGSRDEINLGTCPKSEEPVMTHVEQDYPRDPEYVPDEEELAEEELIPKTDPNYLEAQKEQCDKYVAMLENRFPICNSVNISSKLEKYEGSGGYYEAVVYYNSEDVEQKCQANFIAENLPELWSDSTVFSSEEYGIWYEENKELYDDDDHEWNA